MKSFAQVMSIARAHGYAGSPPASREALTPEQAAELAPHLWKAAEAKAGRRLMELDGIAVGATEFIDKCLAGSVEL